ncbi:MAG: hypothetical protein SPE18_08310 [Candidatus Limivicinus sp.]|nr:hypothetical protein [Candidatus Limivicinus sp.]
MIIIKYFYIRSKATPGPNGYLFQTTDHGSFVEVCTFINCQVGVLPCDDYKPAIADKMPAKPNLACFRKRQSGVFSEQFYGLKSKITAKKQPPQSKAYPIVGD